MQFYALVIFHICLYGVSAKNHAKCLEVSEIVLIFAAIFRTIHLKFIVYGKDNCKKIGKKLLS